MGCAQGQTSTPTLAHATASAPTSAGSQFRPAPHPEKPLLLGNEIYPQQKQEGESGKAEPTAESTEIAKPSTGEAVPKFTVHRGRIPAGDDLGMEVMTVAAAKRKALQMPGCKGFCFLNVEKLQSRSLLHGRDENCKVEVFFKSRWELVQSAKPWTAIKVEASDAMLESKSPESVAQHTVKAAAPALTCAGRQCGPALLHEQPLLLGNETNPQLKQDGESRKAEPTVESAEAHHPLQDDVSTAEDSASFVSSAHRSTQSGMREGHERTVQASSPVPTSKSSGSAADLSFTVHKGRIAAGGDMGMEIMTVSEAKRKASEMPGCKGFCFLNTEHCFHGLDENCRVEIFFKSRWELVQVAKPWTAIKLETSGTVLESTSPQSPVSRYLHIGADIGPTSAIDGGVLGEQSPNRGPNVCSLGEFLSSFEDVIKEAQGSPFQYGSPLGKLPEETSTEPTFVSFL